MRRFLLMLIALTAGWGCTEDVANLDLIQACPMNAVVMVPVRDAQAVKELLAETEWIQDAELLQLALDILPLNTGNEALLSLHPVGAGPMHWVLSMRRGFSAFHPSNLADYAPARRSYSSGTIWEWSKDGHSWALSETSEWLMLSSSDILAEEAIRQLEAGGGGASYTNYPELASQLSSSAFVTLYREGSTALASRWPIYPMDSKHGLPDDLRSWRFFQEGSQAWTVRYAADSSAQIAVSNPQLRSETLAFSDSTEARAFPGWRWMRERLLWSQWIAVDGRVNYQGHPFAVQAQGMSSFRGRRSKDEHRISMWFSESAGLTIPYWRPSGELVAENSLHLKKALPVLSFVKTQGPYILSAEAADTAAINRYAGYISDQRDSSEEADYQMAIRWLRSQPSEGHMWWLSRGGNPAAPWSGLTYRAQGEEAYWSASGQKP